MNISQIKGKLSTDGWTDRRLYSALLIEIEILEIKFSSFCLFLHYFFQGFVYSVVKIEYLYFI